VPFRMLFFFADGWDWTLMAVGSVASAGAGALMPLFAYTFGNVLNAFFAVNPREEINKSALNFAYLAIGAFFANFVASVTVRGGRLVGWTWILAGRRQAAALPRLTRDMILSTGQSFRTTSGKSCAALSCAGSSELPQSVRLATDKHECDDPYTMLLQSSYKEVSPKALCSVRSSVWPRSARRVASVTSTCRPCCGRRWRGSTPATPVSF
jgi:hypothetical protein